MQCAALTTITWPSRLQLHNEYFHAGHNGVVESGEYTPHEQKNGGERAKGGIRTRMNHYFARQKGESAAKGQAK